MKVLLVSSKNCNHCDNVRKKLESLKIEFDEYADNDMINTTYSIKMYPTVIVMTDEGGIIRYVVGDIPDFEDKISF